jgi:hypothetical protein
VATNANLWKKTSEAKMSKQIRKLPPFQATIAGAFLAWATTPVNAAEPVSEPSTEPLMFSEGAKAMVCDRLGFLAIVRTSDEKISSPQFPLVQIQHSDGLFALTEEQVEIEGLSVSYTSFLKYRGGEEWVFSGFDGTQPFEDTCRDITGDLAFSFSKIALAASWGMPHIEERVRLFDAIQDDLQTRLELAGAEKDELERVTSRLEDENDRLSDDLGEILTAVCEVTAGADDLVTEASLQPAADARPAGISALRTAASSAGGCISDTVLTSSRNLPAR